MNQESEPKIEEGKGVEDVEKEDAEEEITIEKAAICVEGFSKKEIAKFLPVIKDIRKNIPEQDKKKWVKMLTPHFLGTRFEKMLKQQVENVIEIEQEGKEGGIEFKPERGAKWFTEKEGEKESLIIWRLIEENEGKLKKFQPVEIIFEQDEIQEIMDKLLTAIENIDEQELERIKQEKEKERKKSHHHKIKIV